MSVLNTQELAPLIFEDKEAAGVLDGGWRGDVPVPSAPTDRPAPPVAVPAAAPLNLVEHEKELAEKVQSAVKIIFVIGAFVGLGFLLRGVRDYPTPLRNNQPISLEVVGCSIDIAVENSTQGLDFYWQCYNPSACPPPSNNTFVTNETARNAGDYCFIQILVSPDIQMPELVITAKGRERTTVLIKEVDFGPHSLHLRVENSTTEFVALVNRSTFAAIDADVGPGYLWLDKCSINSSVDFSSQSADANFWLTSEHPIRLEYPPSDISCVVADSVDHLDSPGGPKGYILYPNGDMAGVPAYTVRLNNTVGGIHVVVGSEPTVVLQNYTTAQFPQRLLARMNLPLKEKPVPDVVYYRVTGPSSPKGLWSLTNKPVYSLFDETFLAFSTYTVMGPVYSTVNAWLAPTVCPGHHGRNTENIFAIQQLLTSVIDAANSSERSLYFHQREKFAGPVWHLVVDPNSQQPYNDWKSAPYWAVFGLGIVLSGLFTALSVIIMTYKCMHYRNRHSTKDTGRNPQFYVLIEGIAGGVFTALTGQKKEQAPAAPKSHPEPTLDRDKHIETMIVEPYENEATSEAAASAEVGPLPYLAGEAAEALAPEAAGDEDDGLCDQRCKRCKCCCSPCSPCTCSSRWKVLAEILRGFFQFSLHAVLILLPSIPIILSAFFYKRAVYFIQGGFASFWGEATTVAGYPMVYLLSLYIAVGSTYVMLAGLCHSELSIMFKWGAPTSSCAKHCGRRCQGQRCPSCRSAVEIFGTIFFAARIVHYAMGMAFLGHTIFWLILATIINEKLWPYTAVAVIILARTVIMLYRISRDAKGLDTKVSTSDLVQEEKDLAEPKQHLLLFVKMFFNLVHPKSHGTHIALELLRWLTLAVFCVFLVLGYQAFTEQSFQSSSITTRVLVTAPNKAPKKPEVLRVLRKLPAEEDG